MGLKGIFETIGLAFVSLIFSILIGESFVRMVMKPTLQSDPTVIKSLSNQELCKGNTDPYEKEGDCYYLFDSLAQMNFSTLFGYVPAPGISGRGYKTNLSTMRYDQELVEPKTSGEMRVFVTGGSTAWGAGVSQDKLYSIIAEEQLKELFPDHTIKVISAGVGGYISIHEVLRYLLYLRPLAPDAWVMFTGWNDVYANYRGQNYVLSPDMLNLRSAVLAGAMASPIAAERLQEVKQAGSIITSYQKPLWGGYDLKLHWLVDMAKYKLARIRGKDSNTSSMNEQGPVQPKKAVDMLLTNISIAANLARRDGVKLLVVLQPDLYTTNKKLTSFERDILEKNASTFPGLKEYYREVYPLIANELRMAADKEGFVFIDSDKAIETEERTVFADHVHLGDRGNTLIGKLLTESLGVLFVRETQ